MEEARREMYVLHESLTAVQEAEGVETGADQEGRSGLNFGLSPVVYQVGDDGTDLS